MSTPVTARRWHRTRDILVIRTILLAALAASTLAACTPGPGTPDDYKASSVSGGLLLYSETAGGVSDAHVLAQLATTPRPQQTGTTQRIAVTRGFTLRLPSNEVAAVQERHLAECAK